MKSNRMTIKKLTDSGEWKVCVYINNKLDEDASAYCGDRQEAEETKFEMEKFFKFDQPKVRLNLSLKQYDVLSDAIINESGGCHFSLNKCAGVSFSRPTNCSQAMPSTEELYIYCDIEDEKVFYKFLEANWTDAYRNDRMDEHNDLVNIKTLLFTKYRISSTFTKKLKKFGEIQFNIHYNSIIDYGSFEYYTTDDDDIYAEGGLWFKDGELVDYDGVYSLPKAIREQLDKWNLDTSYLD